MRKKISIVAIATTAFVFGVGFAPSAFAGAVLNENFDELTPALSATSVGAFSAIDGTNVDIVGPANSFGALCASPESGNCVDLGGTGGNQNGILQSNSELGAGTYSLSFDLIGSGRGQTDTTEVTLGNYDQMFTLASGDTTDGIVTDALVTLTAPGYLTFFEDAPIGGNGAIGNVLDNVSISTAATAVPEPLTLSLFGAGLAGAAALRRRKKAKA